MVEVLESYQIRLLSTACKSPTVGFKEEQKDCKGLTVGVGGSIKLTVVGNLILVQLFSICCTQYVCSWTKSVELLSTVPPVCSLYHSIIPGAVAAKSAMIGFSLAHFPTNTLTSVGAFP